MRRAEWMKVSRYGHLRFAPAYTPCSPVGLHAPVLAPPSHGVLPLQRPRESVVACFLMAGREEEERPEDLERLP